MLFGSYDMTADFDVGRGMSLHPTNDPSVGAAGVIGRRILIVEDDAAAAFALGEIFRHLKCESRATGSVAQAISALEQSTFDHAVVDLMLPDGEGSRVVAYIRARRLPINIVVATASSDPGIISRAQQAGADALLQKPLNLRKLLQALGLD